LFYMCTYTWGVGHRPTTADTYPLIGATSMKGLYIASGTKREGVHSSPLIAKSIVAEMRGAPPVYHPYFKPERKLIYDMTREQAVTKTVLHQFSGGYQHGLKLPHAGWEPMLVEAIRKSTEEVYDRLGIHDVGIPPELLNMYRHGHIVFPGAEPRAD
jgi:glycine oxidase